MTFNKSSMADFRLMLVELKSLPRIVRPGRRRPKPEDVKLVGITILKAQSNHNVLTPFVDEP